MSAVREESASHTVRIGDAFEGGFLAGFLTTGDQRVALIVAPKALGEISSVAIHPSGSAAPEATAFDEGPANTVRLAVAGSPAAKWVHGLEINGYNDWYLPSADELEILYRALKPTTEENYVYNRSGLNLSAVPPTRPYTKAVPAQSTIDLFQEGGAEAFDDGWYWSSTVLDDSNYAWFQSFHDGDQGYGNADYELRARAVRRSIL